MSDVGKKWYGEDAGFFGVEYTKLHADRLTGSRTTSEVDFVEKQLALQSGISILDVPCGHGRHSIELARRGFQVTGQDLNGSFLERAVADAHEAGVQVQFRKGDMRDLPFEAQFDVVLNLFTSFGYLEAEEEDQIFLDAVVKTLRPGGKFVLDFSNRDKIMRNWGSQNWKRLVNGLIVIDERSFNLETGREEGVSIHLYPDGTRKQVERSHRLYTLRELILMCKQAGLEFRETFGDFDGSPVSLSSPRVILITQKM